MPTSTSPLLLDLNPIQKEAVLNTEGPTLILAGAGSGKTKVLTHRVAYLIKEKGIPAENILMITFTNKASTEMKDRVLKLLNPESPTTNPQPNAIPTMGTFHWLCSKILRRDGFQIGLARGFSIYDEGDALDAVKEAITTQGLNSQKISPSAIRATISNAKNEMISSLEYPTYARGYFQETVAKVYLEYQRILEKNQGVDFDDLLLLVVKLFQNVPETLAYYQILFRYIMIDEYQDTNQVQYILSKLLANRYKNICIVGDASQSIYSFRGADYRNIINFKTDYPAAKVFNLEQNYRSTQIILDAAHAIISKNKTHPILSLWTDKKQGAKIGITETRNEVDEGQFILNTIKQMNLPLSSFAILYRTNAQSRALEETFLKSGIPYTLVGGTRFYERKEIKDVLSYLRLVSNPKDSISKKRIEKIGKGRMNKFLELIPQLGDGKRGAPETARREVVTTEDISGAVSRQDPAPEGHRQDPDSLAGPALNRTTLEILDLVLEKTGYLEYLDDGTEAGKSRVENVKELRSVAEQFPELVEFLSQVALVENEYFSDEKAKKAGNKSAVTLTTLHQAKGLEWPVVFLVGMEEGLFPHSRSFLDPQELEEERRLCYVGITRAKDKLFLTYSRQRLIFGTRSNNLVSRFIIDIPQNLIESSFSYSDSDTGRMDTPKLKREDYLDDIYTDKDEDDWLKI